MSNYAEDRWSIGFLINLLRMHLYKSLQQREMNERELSEKSVECSIHNWCVAGPTGVMPSEPKESQKFGDLFARQPAPPLSSKKVSPPIKIFIPTHHVIPDPSALRRPKFALHALSRSLS